jgi:hypothetical protein
MYVCRPHVRRRKEGGDPTQPGGVQISSHRRKTSAYKRFESCHDDQINVCVLPGELTSARNPTESRRRSIMPSSEKLLLHAHGKKRAACSDGSAASVNLNTSFVGRVQPREEKKKVVTVATSRAFGRNEKMIRTAAQHVNNRHGSGRRHDGSNDARI